MGNGTFENLIPLLFIAFLLLPQLMKFLGRLLGKDFSDLTEDEEFEDYAETPDFEAPERKGEGEISDKPINPKWF